MNWIQFIILFFLCLFLIYISFRIFFIDKNEFLKIIYFFVFGIILFIFLIRSGLCNFLEKLINYDIKGPLINFILLSPIIIRAPNLRNFFNNLYKWRNKNKKFILVNRNTQEQILEAVLEMSEKKIGALITIEKHNSLEQFAKKSILIDANISKELLMNIFIPNTPLHDGAVIIRGNKILSAGAYFMLSEGQYFQKTTGSRHRAALGISENTDSMTIIVSEETGKISIALEGIMLQMKDANQIKEYLITFII
ncbi:Diadenylate cyclase [Candidatus Phytoplasma rubi]|uniref:Diadenylate cyclase n=1 Tax=Candidatus Phytoplasma rubi TaxID=399025 RepID=A0ABY7BS56_9MOLU|nr:DNA integrity scanning protein DisA nucleotide-binding domain protein [Candidatus Phytoplasma rubi]WAN63474.1 Diadenylate cyclase [Candidatus Phytoplasma rubi]